MIYYKYVYLWIGITEQSEESFLKYFKLDCLEQDIDSPNYKVCSFCRDVGEKWYDEDFQCFHSPLKDHVNVGELLEILYSGVDENEYAKIFSRCKDLGIEKANALFSYTVSDDENDWLEIIDEQKRFNDLYYVGRFLHE